MTRLRLSFYLSILLLTIANTAAASGYYGENPEHKPSVFTYAFKGFGIGALVGTGVGYLAVRNEDFSDNWKPFALSVGIGTIAGVGLGLGTGFIDLASEHPGIGGIILRDTLYGTVLGIGVGVVAGLTSALVKNEWEYLAFGPALGAVIGAGAGLVIGIIEGGVQSARRKRENRRTITLTVSSVPGYDSQTIVMPAIKGTF
ncbi:MAG: hypothetical protein QNJ97_02860 [Myxococcota bacterium]|nr:hypothetical protein [Myxococcota bacterium]